MKKKNNLPCVSICEVDHGGFRTTVVITGIVGAQSCEMKIAKCHAINFYRDGETERELQNSCEIFYQSRSEVFSKIDPSKWEQKSIELENDRSRDLFPRSEHLRQILRVAKNWFVLRSKSARRKKKQKEK